MRAFRLAYDGTPYYGFQRQPDLPTVEDAVFDALEALEVLESRTVGGTGGGDDDISGGAGGDGGSDACDPSDGLGYATERHTYRSPLSRATAP